MGTNVGKDVKRGLIGALTYGTSEIKTGSGKYHDETFADAFFPKEVNNWALEDRQKKRGEKDAADLADVEAARPTPGPDLGDKLLKRAGATSLLKTKQGRKSTFLGDF